MIEFDCAPSSAIAKPRVALDAAPKTATGGNGGSLIPPRTQQFAQPSGSAGGMGSNGKASKATPAAPVTTPKPLPTSIPAPRFNRTPDRIKARKIQLLERRYARARLAAELATFKREYAARQEAEAREARESMRLDSMHASAVASIDLLTPQVIRHWQAWREDRGGIGFEYVESAESP